MEREAFWGVIKECPGPKPEGTLYPKNGMRRLSCDRSFRNTDTLGL